ncbi:MAG: hypothetical protein E5X46_13640 [Mesorhizobium sp.]|nr:MAG: hypothetical protein E5X46_13640 [Mesorhizobium sp.]
MDITNASMTSLLKEALTPQPVPSAKADPATAALVKALVQPPAPSFVPSAQVGAQALNGSLPRPAAEPSQRLSSAEVENAYRPSWSRVPAPMAPRQGLRQAGRRLMPTSLRGRPPRRSRPPPIIPAGSRQRRSLPSRPPMLQRCWLLPTPMRRKHVARLSAPRAMPRDLNPARRRCGRYPS